MSTILIWGGFVVLVLIILAFDLGAFSRGPAKAISARQALFRTAVYVCLSMIFTVFVYYSYENHWFELGVYPEADAADEGDDHSQRPRLAYWFEPELKSEAGHGLPSNGQEAATMYFTGYLVEQSLSMDNIFVIALILGFFKVPAAYQHRVLYWGILGALVMRGVMIALGAQLIHAFDWIIYVFGALLVYTAWKMLGSDEDHLDPNESRTLKILRKFVHVHPGFDGDHFFSTVDGIWGATPLFLSLVIVETTDLIFAVDSIPAVFGITHDPFLVFTSNVFAILGLRSLYFALADLLDKFRFLKYSLVAILAFVGIKMLAHAMIEISPLVSLTGIGVFLALGIGASWWIPEPAPAEAEVTASNEPN
ncbi:TerC/Alx family metal homeostasis membrane protein [bacterium]|nr:TerC/Alx family metal homeostasis membrane protein [bacterium]